MTLKTTTLIIATSLVSLSLASSMVSADVLNSIKYSPEQGSNNIDSFTFDQSNNLWIASDDYVYDYLKANSAPPEIQVTEYSKDNYRNSILQYTIPGNNGDLTSDLTSIEYEDNRPPEYATSIAIDQKDDVWVLVSATGAESNSDTGPNYDIATVYEIPVNSSSSFKPIARYSIRAGVGSTMSIDNNGNLWISNAATTLTTKSPLLLEIPKPSSPASQPIDYTNPPASYNGSQAMTIDPSDNVWLAGANSERVIEVQSGSSPTAPAKQYTLPSVPQNELSPAVDIVSDNKGNIWVINSDFTLDEIPANSSTDTIAKQVVKLTEPNYVDKGSDVNTIGPVAANKAGLWYVAQDQDNNQCSLNLIVANADGNSKSGGSFKLNCTLPANVISDNQGNLWFYDNSIGNETSGSSYLLFEYLTSDYKVSNGISSLGKKIKANSSIDLYAGAAALLVIFVAYYTITRHKKLKTSVLPQEDSLATNLPVEQDATPPTPINIQAPSNKDTDSHVDEEVVHK